MSCGWCGWQCSRLLPHRPLFYSRPACLALILPEAPVASEACHCQYSCDENGYMTGGGGGWENGRGKGRSSMEKWRGSIYACELFSWPHYSREYWLPVHSEIHTLVSSNPREETLKLVTLGDLRIFVRVGKGKAVCWFVCFSTCLLWELLSLEMVAFNRYRRLCSACPLKEVTLREKRNSLKLVGQRPRTRDGFLLGNTLVPINTYVHSSRLPFLFHSKYLTRLRQVTVSYSSDSETTAVPLSASNTADTKLC
jgi:hypothetical protein